MTICCAPSSRGIALIIVMVIILVLGILAGGFAYSMKVESKLASNTSLTADLEWLGRSGVEFAKYLLGQQLNLEPLDSLKQKWAGGPGNTNDLLAGLTLDNNHVGQGLFSVKIIDLERKMNINSANEFILQQVFHSIGLDPGQSATVIDSIMDWRDPDNDVRLNGTESEYYLELQPPYFAKNGIIDDLSELLLVRGMTPELFWGPEGKERRKTIASSPVLAFGYGQAPSFSGGLADIFTTASGPLININTAPLQVLQLLPGFDENIAAGILHARAGFDGMEGTEDDIPFHNVGELINIPGMNPQFVTQLQRIASVRSFTFEVQVEAQIADYKKRYVAVLRRNSPNNLPVLSMHEE